jgi:hypothetical protein
MKAATLTFATILAAGCAAPQSATMWVRSDAPAAALKGDAMH